MPDNLVRSRSLHLALGAVIGATVLVAATALAGNASSAGRPGTAGTPAGTIVAPVSAAPSAVPSPDASPSPVASPSPAPSATAAPQPPAAPPPPAPTSPKPKPSRAPTTEQGPPPPAAEPLPADVTCPYYDGENAPQAQVEAALDAAAARRFWTVSQVSLPANLLKAVAWQESGWQSAIIACDGGIGTMQVMPSTADWMNQRFGVSYDVHTLDGNTMLGSAFLQWLIKYFGDAYFDGDYTVRGADCQQDPELPDHREWCLLNAVISAYNFGHGAVDAQVDKGDGIYYPNHQYIENVRALMLRY